MRSNYKALLIIALLALGISAVVAANGAFARIPIDIDGTQSAQPVVGAQTAAQPEQDAQPFNCANIAALGLERQTNFRAMNRCA